jgi:hypothetical protein
MENRAGTLIEWVRRAVIGTGYLGLAGIIVGIFVTFINRYNPLGTFDSISEISGITVLAVGAVLLVASAFTVWKWFKKD